MGGNEYGKSGHLSIFVFFKAFNDAFEVQFFRASFYTLSKTLIACRAMQLRFLKVETLLNNAFIKVKIECYRARKCYRGYL